MECGRYGEREMRQEEGREEAEKETRGRKRVVRGQHLSDQRSRLVEVLLRKDGPSKGNISTK
jgi:hypothetical protein